MEALRIRSEFEPVPRYEPSTYQPIKIDSLDHLEAVYGPHLPIKKCMSTFQQTFHTTVIVILDVERWSRFTHPGRSPNRRTVLFEREREMFYLTTHSTHFIYGYMASDIWLRTILILRKETRCRHRLLLSISSKGSFICTIPQTG